MQPLELMTPRSNRLGLILASLGALWSAPNASASWIDSDFYCRIYGCVIVHDGTSFWVYDNFIFATGGTVPPGERMIPRAGNPIQGSGAISPVITGTLTEGPQTVPLQDQSVRLGIDTTGDGVPDQFPADANNSGFLDAGDRLDPFALTLSTDLVTADTSAQRSFYLTSRTDFYVVAELVLLGSRDQLNQQNRINNVGFTYDVTRTGRDDGIAFGVNARRGGDFIRPIGSVSNLRDVYGAPTQILEFRRPIRRRNAADMMSQSVRFDYVYGFENYDLSMGTGHLEYQIEFAFYNR